MYTIMKMKAQTGSKPLPLHANLQTDPKPAKREKRTYTREKKLAVIKWISDPANYVFDGNKNARIREGMVWNDSHRPPTDEEASEFWRIPKSNIGKWWRERERILKMKKGSRTDVSRRKEKKLGMGKER
jgi:hypothetical protein